MLKESVILVAGIVVVGFSYYFANKHVIENEVLKYRNKELENKIYELEANIEVSYFDNTELIYKNRELLVENKMNVFKIRTLKFKIKNMKKRGFRKIMRAKRLGGK
jgi:hypothetical protein